MPSLPVSRGSASGPTAAAASPTHPPPSHTHTHTHTSAHCVLLTLLANNSSLFSRPVPFGFFFLLCRPAGTSARALRRSALRQGFRTPSPPLPQPSGVRLRQPLCRPLRIHRLPSSRISRRLTHVGGGQRLRQVTVTVLSSLITPLPPASCPVHVLLEETNRRPPLQPLPLARRRPACCGLRAEYAASPPLLARLLRFAWLGVLVLLPGNTNAASRRCPLPTRVTVRSGGPPSPPLLAAPSWSARSPGRRTSAW